ncbi:RNA polymerase sigma factor [soil metagenome]
MASGGRVAETVPGFPLGSDPETLFRVHGRWLLRALRQRFGAAVAEDLVQETYLRLVRQSQPVEIIRPKAYLLHLARNAFIDGYRRDRQRSELEARHYEAQGQTEAAGQVQTLILKEAILGMPQKLRDVFVLSRFGGMNTQAIADHLGVRPKTVEWRMTQALAYCAKHLRE